MSKFKFGIFDLDGTVFDAMPLYTEVYSQLLKERYEILPKNSVGYYLESAGTPLNEQFRFMFELNNKPADKILEMAKEFFEIVNKKDFALFDGAKNILENLRKKGMMLFITTGSEDEMTKKRLERTGILKYFSLVLGSSQKEKGPWHIEEFTRSAKISIAEFSKQAFYCGDGPRDMSIAKIFGIYAIGVAQTVSKQKLLESSADVVVDKIREVIGLDILK